MGTTMRLMSGALVFGLLAVACGGAEPEPPKAPETTAVATTPAPPAPPAPTPEPPKPSQAELVQKNSQIAMEGWAQRDAKKIASTYAENAVVKSAGFADVTGREAIQKDFQGRFDAFSNSKVGVSHVFSKGDVTVTVFQFTGTHSGEYRGYKATEKPIGFTGAEVTWYDQNGLVKESHEYWDFPTVLTQAGVIKGKARPIPAISEKPMVVVANDADGEAKRVEMAKGWIAAMDAKKDADVLAVSADDFVLDPMTELESVKGKDANKKVLQAMFKAFPDGKTTVANVWGIGDFVITESSFTGTHKGQMGPMKPTNKSITMHGLDVAQFANGKVAHVWSFGNSAEALSQVNAMPKPTATAAKTDAKAADPKAAPKATTPAPTAAPKPKTDTKPAPKK